MPGRTGEAGALSRSLAASSDRIGSSAGTAEEEGGFGGTEPRAGLKGVCSRK